jgi:sugar lactone lactonase YvrE
MALRPAAILALSILALASGSGMATDRATAEPLYVASDYVTDGVFTKGIEGPATGPDGYLYVVNFAREGTIGRVATAADGHGQAELFVQLPEGSTGNGIRFDHAGRMVVADYRGHNILRIDMRSHAIKVFAHDDRLHQPNDIAMAADGGLYASDPDWAHDSGQIWRIEPDGRMRLLETGMGTANGIDVSPDGKHLYVNESVQRKIWRYDIQPDGSIGGKRLLIAFADHGMDGMRTDAQGNLLVARYGAGSVAMVSPAGKLLREIPLKGSKPTNVAFGGADGRTVYVTLQDRGAVERFRTAYPGREYGDKNPSATSVGEAGSRAP